MQRRIRLTNSMSLFSFPVHFPLFCSESSTFPPVQLSILRLQLRLTDSSYRRISMNFLIFVILLFLVLCHILERLFSSLILHLSFFLFFLSTNFSFVLFHLDFGWRVSLVILSILHCRSYVQSTLHLHRFSDLPLWYLFFISQQYLLRIRKALHLASTIY